MIVSLIDADSGACHGCIELPAMPASGDVVLLPNVVVAKLLVSHIVWVNGGEHQVVVTKKDAETWDMYLKQH